MASLIVVDFETYYDKQYSLSKLTIEEYVRNSQFEVIGVGLYLPNSNKKYWLTEQQFRKIAPSLNGANILAHNTLFDGAILSWRYGVKAGLWLDTLSMARGLRGVTSSNSLKALAEYYKLGAKGEEVIYALGKHYVDFTPEEYARYGEYCLNDCELAYRLFRYFYYVHQYPVGELKVIDLTLRMFIEPSIVLDESVLQSAYDEEVDKLNTLLRQLNIDESVLASNEKFAELLRSLGVDPPVKISKTTGKQTYAFAKTDIGFQDLLNSDNELIVSICEARLRTKSTIIRTRAQKLLDIARRGPLPVPLQYYGAHTGRFSAASGQAINMQNLKRGSKLRDALTAPPGHVFCVADFKQIELRVLVTLTNCKTMLDMLKTSDPYATFGAIMFNTPGMTKESHPVLRQAAKSAVLGAGYELGEFSFAAQLLAGFMGAPPVRYDIKFLLDIGYNIFDVQQKANNEKWRNKVLSIPHSCTEAELLIHAFAASTIISKYRSTAPEVVSFWKECEDIIVKMADKTLQDFNWRFMKVSHEKIKLPNGMMLRYANLEKADKGYVYGEKKTIYGGKLTENIVQALARIIMTDAMMRIAERYKVVLTVHDELVVLIKESEIEEAKEWLYEKMTIRPQWMPELPLDVDIGISNIYGKAKE